MSDLSTAIKNLKYDKRMRAWNIKQKYLTEEEWRKRIEGLRDLSSKAEKVPNPDPDPQSGQGQALDKSQV